MVAVIVAILGFIVYHYRKKNHQPLVVNRDRAGYADSPYGREYLQTVFVGADRNGHRICLTHRTILLPLMRENSSQTSRTAPQERKLCPETSR